MIHLETNRYRATLDADLGGMVDAFETADGVPLLKSDRQHGLVHGFPTWGIPLLVPFSNRLDPRTLPSGNGPVQMPLNWPDEGLAIHGTVFDKPWTVTDANRQEAALKCDVLDAAMTVIGAAELNAELTDAEGLNLKLSFRNLSDAEMACGIGYHPWFPGDCKLQFQADTRLVPDHRLMPFKLEAAGDEVLTMEADGHDSFYAGWSGEAVLTNATWPAPLILTGQTRFLHTFVGSQFDGICAEPVSHAPNAAHNGLSAQQGPLMTLQYGDTLSLKLSLKLAD